MNRSFFQYLQGLALFVLVVILVTVLFAFAMDAWYSGKTAAPESGGIHSTRTGVARLETLLLPVEKIETRKTLDGKQDAYTAFCHFHPSDFQNGRVPKHLDIRILISEHLQKNVELNGVHGWIKDEDTGKWRPAAPPVAYMLGHDGWWVFDNLHANSQYALGIVLIVRYGADVKRIEEGLRDHDYDFQTFLMVRPEWQR